MTSTTKRSPGDRSVTIGQITAPEGASAAPQHLGPDRGVVIEDGDAPAVVTLAPYCSEWRLDPPVGAGPNLPKDEPAIEHRCEAVTGSDTHKAGEVHGTMRLPVEGMTCDGCARSVQLALGQVPGVRGVDVDAHRLRPLTASS